MDRASPAAQGGRVRSARPAGRAGDVPDRPAPADALRCRAAPARRVHRSRSGCGHRQAARDPRLPPPSGCARLRRTRPREVEVTMILSAESFRIARGRGPAVPSLPTFVFADLAGYTALTEQHGDETAAAVAHEFARVM